MRYGPVFRLLLGGRYLTVVASEEAIHNVLLAEHGVFSPRTQAYQVFRAIGSDATLYPRLYDVASQDLFLLLDKRLAKRALNDITPGFAKLFFDRLKQFTKSQQVSLKRSLTEPLYFASNAILLGSRFSPDTYDDYVTFNDSIPSRLSMRPFWPFPSSRARKRLLEHISKYLENADATKFDDKLGSSFIEIFRDRNLSTKEGAYLVLSFMIALYMNPFNVVFWLMAWLLADPSALHFVREEIDRAVREEFGGLQQFVAHANPENLQSSSFPYLHSAILETLRLSSMLTGLRDAESDFDLKEGDKVTPLKKGEHIVAYTWAIHRDERAYKNAHSFVADRFIHIKDQENMMRSPSKAYIPFGAGKNSVSPLGNGDDHIAKRTYTIFLQCKGRLLAIYQIKVLAILYLSLFDVTPVRRGDDSRKWEPPQSSTGSTGTIHTSEDVVVKLRPRFDV